MAMRGGTYHPVRIGRWIRLRAGLERIVDHADRVAARNDTTGHCRIGRLIPVNREEHESLWTRWASYFSANVRAGSTRVKGALVPNTQMAAFATISWLICEHLLGSPSPIFAPIVTFSCLGFSRNRQPRTVVEVGLGTSTGVLIGGLMGHYFGFGWWQLLLLFLFTPLIGRFIDRSELVGFQVAVNSVVVASMMVLGATDPAGGPLDRWLNALIGAGVALLATIILPNNVVTRPRRYVALVIDEMSRTLRHISKGLLDGDAVQITQLTGRLTSIRESLNDGRRALDSAQETAAISPQAFGSRDVLAELDRMLQLAERLHVTIAMMHRQSRNMVTEVGPLPDLAAPMWQAADLLQKVAAGVRDWRRPTEARDEAAKLASSLGPNQIVTDKGDWRTATLTSLLRAVVVDLLELTGLSMAQARATLADTGDYVPEEEDDAMTVEQSSVVWGTETLPAVQDPDDRDPGAAGANAAASS